MNTFVPEILGYEEAVLKDGKKYIYSKMAFILRISICIYLYISLNNYFLLLIQLGPYMFVNRHSFIAFFLLLTKTSSSYSYIMDMGLKCTL